MLSASSQPIPTKAIIGLVDFYLCLFFIYFDFYSIDRYPHIASSGSGVVTGDKYFQVMNY